MEGLAFKGLAVAAGADLLAAILLRGAAGTLLGSRQNGARAATAYLCAATAVLTAGWGGPAASLQNAVLLGAAAAALTPGGSLLSAVLLAAGCADWLAGAVLLAAPLALIVDGSGSRDEQCAGCSSNRLGSDITSTHTGNGSRSTNSRLSGPRMAKQLVGYCCCFAATAGSLVLSRRLLLPHQAAWLCGWLEVASWQDRVPAVPPAELGQDPLAWVGSRAFQQPPHQRGAVLLPVASLQPGIGLHWYLLAQVFPQFRSFFLYALEALPAALMLPLALRFPKQPRLLLSAGALARCLLHPRPQPAMAALWLGLLPLASPQLVGLPGPPWMALGVGAGLLLNASAADLWLGSGGGNANFLYGMNLLWAGLQTVLFLRLLRAAARQEAAASTKNDSQAANVAAEAPPAGGSAVTAPGQK